MAALIKPVAFVHNDLPEKFGVPRQAGLAPELLSELVFEPEYRNADALRGLEGYSHVWLIWGFSGVEEEAFRPTVRPPRLGGNTHMGVFATRSPFRPNRLGLSSVKLVKIEPDTPRGPVITVSGLDCTDGTPVYDIKPFLPYTDNHTDARGGFAEAFSDYALKTDMGVFGDMLPPDKREALEEILANDPRPSYQNDPERVYGLSFAGYEIKFTVDGDTLTVTDISGTKKG